MTTSAPFPFDEFLHSQLYLESVIRPSGTAHFAAYAANNFFGEPVQITVGPRTSVLLGSFWEVTVRHQPHPVAVRRTRDEAVEAAQEIRRSIGGAANIWLKGADGRYRAEWTYPRWRDSYPPIG